MFRKYYMIFLIHKYFYVYFITKVFYRVYDFLEEKYKVEYIVYISLGPFAINKIILCIIQVNVDLFLFLSNWRILNAT